MPLEKYTRGVSAVESILTLDRLRQNVAVKELETTHGQSLSMRKTVSVPNFSQVIYYEMVNFNFFQLSKLSVVAAAINFTLYINFFFFFFNN